MSNAKRFLSVILAIVMICSTLVVGANAAYTAYKDSAIKDQYNALDKPVLTTAQYASAAMDELDRMLNKEQITMTQDELFGIGSLDVTSVDATMDSVYNLVNSPAFSTFKGLLGDLSTLNADFFSSTQKTFTVKKPDGSDEQLTGGGIRRATSGKTDIDVIYQVLGFLYANRTIFVKYARGGIDPAAGGINAGSILPSVVDLSEYTDVNKLLKGLLYEATYDEDAPANVGSLSIDSMVQDIVDRYVVDEFEIDGVKIGHFFEGKTDISNGTMYDFIDEALKTLYNVILVDLLNGNVKYEINKFCEVSDIVTDSTYHIISSDTSTANQYANLINVNYTVSEFNFAEDKTFVAQFNNVVGSLVNTMLAPAYATKVNWVMGDNSKLLSNLINVAKTAVKDPMLAESLFQPYNTRYTDAEIDAMNAEQLITYLLRILINNSADELWIPESATTMREFGYYCLEQLLATAAPELDFSKMDKNSTDTLVVMGIDFAIYNINAVLDMGLEYVDSMTGVDQQLAKAAAYGVNNYGGLLNGITFTNKNNGWQTLDDILFSIFDKTWLPQSCYEATYCFKTLLIDTIIDGILDLDFAGLLGKLENNHPGGLNDAPKTVVLQLVARIIDVIFPGAINANATTFDEIATNAALANTLNAIFSDLYNYRQKLVQAILPTLCDILELTSEQEFKFPDYTYDTFIYDASNLYNFYIPMRNGSTGINTGYTDANGEFHQDALYTYRIRGITATGAASKNITINKATYSTLDNDGVTYTDYTGSFGENDSPTLAGGKTGYIHIDAKITSGTGMGLCIAVTYDVLTEDGSKLTEEPITDYLYTYLSKSQNDNETVKTFDTNSGNVNVTVSLPQNNYPASMRDLLNIEAEVTNKTTKTFYANAALRTANANYTKLLNTGWVELNDEETEIKPGFAVYKEDGVTLDKIQPTKTSVQIFKTTEAYEALPNNYPIDEATGEPDKSVKTKIDAWEEIWKAGSTINATTGAVTLYCKFASMPIAIMMAEQGVTKVDCTKTGTAYTMNLMCYDNMGLASTLSNETGKHRQESNYTDASAWNTYETAMLSAADAVYSAFLNNNFNTAAGKCKKTVTAAGNLEEAIEALDACEQGGGFDTILSIISEINPENVDEDGNKLSYDDPNYKFFGVASYEPYTYYNYKDEYKAAMRAYESTIPDDEGNFEIVSALKVAELEHRLKLYGDRLLLKDVVLTHLQARVAQAQATDATNEAKYTAESWAAYVKAYNFANTVLGTAEANLTQNQVNKAYEILNEYEKCLVPAGDVPGGDTPEFNPVDPSTEAPLTVLETASEGNLLGGVTPGADPTALFETKGCTVDCEMKGAKLATGDVITIKDNGGNVIATYTVCISGDVNCDGVAGSSNDLLKVLDKVNFVVTFNELITNAGDLTNDGKCDSNDLISVLNVVNFVKNIDFVNRTTK